ncbi:MBL fold metallo-hydrolase [Amycolatopsis acidicola]|uniref:MBL fold metallo-hydrolase n=1 Tax=Amycolatopsis acidicola TaxID=2596893 RepID=A0A5N0V152_9PSEU|nr:MBL fold metallo-hydrolase [Amycolatopsis acidicola]KAA9160189.1 MBL fold metallo-hydrolase [Amycolatopsis acidicola]
MPVSRRHVLKSAAAVPVVGAGAAAIPGTGAHLVLLGTAAGPVPMAGRTGISTALVVDGRTYLIDLGHGAFDQFQKSGLDLGTLDRIFVTHLHSDHLADLYTLLWLRFGGVNPMTHPVDVYGPGPAGALPAPSSGQPTPVVSPGNPTPGLADFFANSLAATAYDVNLRMRDEAWPDIRELYRVHEIPLPDVGASATGDLAPPMQPFPVMADDHVSVSAILVRHPPVFPSFAFRFDTAHGSVVLGGDTTITPNMVTLARGADVLVHEAIDLRVVEQAGTLTPEQLQHHRNAHSDVTRIGREIAQPAGVRTLVLSHLAPGSKLIPDASWKAQASQGFDGEVIVGNDLLRIPVGR